MSTTWTVLETVCETLVTAMNTSRPAGVPVTERDRFVDVDATDLPACVLTGWEDDPVEHQDAFRVLDQRTATLTFMVYAAGAVERPNLAPEEGGPTTLPQVTGSQAIDPIVAWLVAQCGPVEAGSALAGTGVSRVTCRKRVAAMGKDNLIRCAVELSVDYQHLVNDATRSH